MKRTCTRVLRSALSLVLVFCLTLSLCGAAFATEPEKTIKYVSLGASNTNGYGLRGYLPGAVTEDPLAASKADLNVYGYQMHPDAAYPAQIAVALDVKEEDFQQLAISSMRTEEVLYLLGDEYDYVNDAYMQWRFTGGQKWFEIAENGGVSALRAAYKDYLANADVITIDLGWNNFGVYAFNNIKTILADGDYWKAPDFDATKAVSEAEYDEIRGSVENYLKDNITDDDTLNSKMTQMLDVLTYATLGAIVHFDSIVGQIYEWNPDAQIVVINIQNLADDLVVEFEGATLELGDLYGELIDLVNLYRASESPYADKYAFADAGDVETFLDEIVVWNGDPTSLGDNMKDCFDMYDDGLYIRSIVEYMMVGQALSELFKGFRDLGASYDLEIFKNDSNYTYEFALTRTPEQLLSLNLGVLDLKNPDGDDADVENYGAALSAHLKNLRGEEANVDAYNYVFENLLAGLNAQRDNLLAIPEEHRPAEVVDGLQQLNEAINTIVPSAKAQFAAKLQGVCDTYHNTLNYAYDVVATVVQYVAGINNIEVNADSLNGFNDAADDMMGIVFGDVVNGAMAKFNYELYANGVQDLPDGKNLEDFAVADYKLDETMFDPALRAILVLAVRYELGNSFFAHPNEAGHDQITNAVLKARESSDAGDFTDGKLTLYKIFLQERYPNLYALIMGAQNVGQMDDLAIIINLLKASGNPAMTAAALDALEANIRAAQSDYAESKTPEQQARAEEVAYDLMQRLYDLVAVTSGSNYKVTEDSYYVSLGDSTISGYGLSGYIDGMKNGAGQVVAGSAHVLLAQEIYGEEWQEHFGNFCQGSLRADDLLLFLGGDVELDDYYYAEIEPNLEDDLAATQAEFIENVEKADLISVAIGGGNFLTFTGKYVNRVVGTTDGEPYELDWERIGIDSTDASMMELQEVLDLLVPVIDALGILDQYLPEGMEMENPAKFARALAEGLIYGFVSYNYYYTQVLDRIKEINPDAQLLVLGMFNPVDDWTMTVNIDGEDKVVNIGGTVSNLMGSANLQSLAYALQNSNTAFIDVSDAETILEAEKPGVELSFNDYYDSSFKSNGKAVHASVGGHKYIADQMAAALSVERQIEIALDALYDVLVTYGPEVAAEVWSQWEEYGYVESVETTMAELEKMLTARYEYYTTEALPAIEGAVGELAAQKDALCIELDALKAELEAKKAELEKVISEQEIGSVTLPDISIDIELGNNEQTEVPENECLGVIEGASVEAELEAAIADLEHAIAVIEALITDIEADIADMVALAEQIAAAVAELEKTMEDIAAAAEDLAAAVEAAIAVLQDNDGIVDAVIKSFNAARDTVLAANEVLELTLGVAEEIIADIDVMVEKIAADADELLNKVMEDLPGCLATEEGHLLVGAIVLTTAGLEEGKALIEAKLTEELAALEAEYGMSEEEIEAELTALAAEYGITEESINAKLDEIYGQIEAEVNARYAEIEAQLNADIAALEAEAAAQIEALEAEKAALEAQLAEAAEDAIEGIQAQIDRVTGDIATVNEDLACAIEHLQAAAETAYNEIVAEVEAAYNEAIVALEAELAELKATYDEAVAALEAELAALKEAYDKAVDELTAAADKAIADLTEKVEAQLAELDKIGEDLGAILDGIYAEIHDELEAAQIAIEEILKGNLEAIEDLKNVLVELGAEAVIDVVESIVAQIEAMFEEATTDDYVITPDSYYVALGDGSAETESYVEELATYLGIDCNNLAEDGQEMADAYGVIAENAEDIAAADLITIGYSNSTFVGDAVNAAMNGADLDWSTYVTDAGVVYVEDVLADISAELAANGITGELNDMAMAAIESYAYSSVAYACNLPGVVSAIREVNEDAVVIIVGQHNAFTGTTISAMGVEIDLGEYVDYLVTGAAVHGIAYCMITGDAIYVEAPDAATDTPAVIGIKELYAILTDDNALYPNATGDLYIRDKILNALNITTEGLLGDANSDGVVNTLDARVIMMYNVGLDVDINLSVCDVNFDGSVNTLDARAIMMYNVGLITEFKPL